MSEPIANISFDCVNCGAHIVEEVCGLPGYDYSAEVHSEGRGIESFFVTCPKCEKEYNVEISNMFDQFEAEIFDEPDVSVKIVVREEPAEEPESD